MSTSPESPGSPAPVKEGDILASKYRVEKVLGVGGMGVVVAAEHIELGQKVALKFLLQQAAANEDLVGRFLREARASVRLKGSHVAKTLDVGRLESGAPYIVMEYLEGHDLHTEIRSKAAPIPIDVACSYIVQASEGLAEAHALGIVHRDLKPGNLFLTRGVDGRPLVKVLDFGISKTMDTSIGGDGLSLTKTEMLLGSPLYMSPEQMRSSKHVDERSDLWALGAIAYELLTSHVPFEADTILELCFKVAQENAASPKLLREDLPDALCAAVLRCLEKDPKSRFSNVGEVAAAFEPFALARDRGSAERALDVLGTGKRKPMHSVPGETVANAVTVLGVLTPAPIAAPATTPMPGLTPMPAAAPAAVPSSNEPPAQAAWGTTQAQEKSAKSKKGLIAIAVGAALAAGLAIVMFSHKGSGEGTAAGVASAGLVATTAASPAQPMVDASVLTAPPINVPPAVNEPGTAASASASASASAGAAAGTGLSVPSGKAGKPGKPGKPGASASAAVSAATPATASAPAPAAPTAPTAPPAAEPGGFIKVRE